MTKVRNPLEIGVDATARVDIAEYYDLLIVPQRPAPVLKVENGESILTAMRFALLPAWSKEPKVKFATHNARLETIDEKPTWKAVFVKRHCIVPLTYFIEPIYENELAGNMVAFSEAKERVLLAAGVWDSWVNRETGEVIESFSIITHDPLPYIAEVGHDRCPVFLEPKAATVWMGNEGSNAKVLKEYLLASRCEPDLTVKKFRALKPGWEKRRS